SRPRRSRSTEAPRVLYHQAREPQPLDAAEFDALIAREIGTKRRWSRQRIEARMSALGPAPAACRNAVHMLYCFSRCALKAVASSSTYGKPSLSFKARSIQ